MLFRTKISICISASILLTMGIVFVGQNVSLASKPDPLPGRGNGALGVVYVRSQGLYYDTFVTADSLPYKGHFQELVPGDPAETDFGPGDPGYLGGRWWVDGNGNGYMDPPTESEDSDLYFLCPLLPPGRENP